MLREAEGAVCKVCRSATTLYVKDSGTIAFSITLFFITIGYKGLFSLEIHFRPQIRI